MRKKRSRSRIDDAKSIISVSRSDWDELFTSVRDLVDIHAQLKRSRGTEVTRGKLQHSTKPRSRKLRIRQVIGPSVDKTLSRTDEGREKTPLLLFCLNCGRERFGNDKFCDRCGHPVGR